MASDGARKQFWKRSNSKVPGRWVCRGAGSGSGVRGQVARRLPGLRLQSRGCGGVTWTLRRPLRGGGTSGSEREVWGATVAGST